MNPALGDQEREILQTVWRLGRCTVRDVFEVAGRGLAYTTIATVLDRLHAKGYVLRERDGKALVYRPAPKKASVQKALARTMVRKILGQDPLPAIATLVDAVESIDPALVDELARAVAKRRSRRGP